MPTTISGTDGVDNVKVGVVMPADLSTGAPTWNSNGNVGIGTASPQTKLDINGSVNVSNNNSIFFKSTTGSVAALSIQSDNNLVLYTPNAAGITNANPICSSYLNTDNPTFQVNVPITNCPTTCKAWVNFNGFEFGMNTVINSGGNYGNISVTQGSDQGTWAVTGASTSYIGQVYYIRSIAGVANATLGGRNVSNNGLGTFTQTVGFRIVSQSTNTYGIQLLEGPALSSQIISTYTIFITGIRSGYNISNVIRNSTGNYTVNFVTPFKDPYYTASGMIYPAAYSGYNFSYLQLNATTTTSANITLPAANNGGVYTDSQTVTTQFFGN